MLLKPVLPVFEYAINYDYIRTVLCINKEAPAKGCNGKCHLMKELAKAAEAEKPSSSDKKNPVAETLDLFLTDAYAFTISPGYPQVRLQVNSFYSNLYFMQDSTQVFHPPSAII
ncbi:MAG: hypothetical protein EOO13_17340 [Chitinophagaceae bacterium]|nr:MAG: hypothetical protein EOO13_17340 [Chitinophagaceae bacterium]